MKKLNGGTILKIIAWILIITLIIANFTNQELFKNMITIYGILTLIVTIVTGMMIVKQSSKYQKEVTLEDKNKITEYLNKKYTDKLRKIAIKDEKNETLTYTLELISIIDAIGSKFAFLQTNLNSTKEELYQIANDIEENLKEQNLVELQEAPKDIRMMLDIVFKYYDDLGIYIKTK